MAKKKYANHDKYQGTNEELVCDLVHARRYVEGQHASRVVHLTNVDVHDETMPCAYT